MESKTVEKDHRWYPCQRSDGSETRILRALKIRLVACIDHAGEVFVSSISHASGLRLLLRIAPIVAKDQLRFRVSDVVFSNFNQKNNEESFHVNSCAAGPIAYFKKSFRVTRNHYEQKIPRVAQ